LQLAHFLAADASDWAARFCALAADLNPLLPTSPGARLCTAVQEALAERTARYTAQRPLLAQPLLAAEGADVVAAVLRAHPVATGARPLGGKLARLPPHLHAAAVRCSATDSGSSLPGLELDATGARAVAAVAQTAEGDMPPMAWLTLQVPGGVAGSAPCAQLQAAVEAVAGRGALRRVTCRGIRFAAASDGPEQPLLPLLASLPHLESLVVDDSDPRFATSALRQPAGAAAPTASLTALAIHGAHFGAPRWIAHTQFAAASRLQSLTLSGCLLLEGGMSSLAALTSLTRLELRDTPMLDGDGYGDALPEVLAAIAHSLAHLCLVENEALGTHAHALAPPLAAAAGSLRHLDLRAAGIDAEAICALSGAIAVLTGLTALDLSHNELGDAGHATVAHAIRNLPLQALGLRKTGLRVWDGGPVVAVFTSMPHCTKLVWSGVPREVIAETPPERAFRIAHLHCLLMCDTAAAAAAPENLPTLRIVDWTIDVCPADLAMFGGFKSPQLVGNKRLVVVCEPVPAPGCASEVFWAHLHWAKALTELELHCGPAALRAAAPFMPAMEALQRLDVSRSALRSDVAAVVAALVELPALSTLDVSDNGIDDAAAAAAAPDLARLAQLARLALSGNALSADGAVALCGAFEGALPRLRTLELGRMRACALGVAHTIALTGRLSGLEALSRLEVSGTECTRDELHALLPGVQVHAEDGDSDTMW
jgi:Leucine Rich repeat